jgi:hypothetical protein
MNIPFYGGCYCGSIRYECSSEPVGMVKCHCRDCQHVTGGPYAAAVAVPADGFRLTKGQLRYHFTESLAKRKHKRGFCPECGSRITGAESAERSQVVAESIVPSRSYLNDVRFDTQNGFAFITDSGIGGLVVVDLRKKEARRVLADHPSTKADPTVLLKIEGIPLIDEKSGKPFQVHSDGIEIDRAGGYLYYQALVGRTLYRVKLADLEDPNLSDAELGRRAETVATVPASDGLAFRNNAIYFTAIEQDAIVRLNLESRDLAVVVKDARLKWPDTLSFGPDGSLYVTNSQIHLTPRFNHGVSKVKEPFGVYKIENP